MDMITPTQPPKNWLAESILVTLFCCLPFGIAGIVNAAQVSSKFAAGDYDGALLASQEAGKWTKIGFWVGIGVIALYVLFFVVLGVGGFMAASSGRNY
ncbi:MAG: CD225/dispanin family protein [Ferruginibacter sp.]